jgi:hypothetical protein
VTFLLIGSKLALSPPIGVEGLSPDAAKGGMRDPSINGTEIRLRSDVGFLGSHLGPAALRVAMPRETIDRLGVLLEVMS